jgi:hypothetical protein
MFLLIVGLNVPPYCRLGVNVRSPYPLDWLWSPPNLLSNGYRGSIPGDTAEGA